jgi:hypothetical protein
MNRKAKLIVMLLIGSLVLCGTAWAENAHRLGGGLRYWVALDDIDVDDVDEDGFSLILSYQYVMAEYFKLEADLEFLDEGYAGADKAVWSPQAFFLIGKALYGGVGVGINYSDGDWADDPFFALRAGVDLEILPSIFLDINANYRFETWNFDRIEEDIDTDTITVGAILRYQF